MHLMHSTVQMFTKAKHFQADIFAPETTLYSFKCDQVLGTCFLSYGAQVGNTSLNPVCSIVLHINLRIKMGI